MKYIASSLALLIAATAFSQTFTTYTTVDGLPTNNLRDIAISGNGEIWLATQQGVVMYDGTSFTTHNTSTHPGLLSNDITCVASTSNGDVWAGTDLGVSVFDGTLYTSYTTADGLSDNEIRNIKEAPNGDIWLATINGATRYSGGSFTAYGTPDIPFGGSQYVAFAANGDVYLASGLSGVIIFDGSTFSTLNNSDGLISNKVRSIAIDATQNKWVGTAEGISTFDANNLHTGDHTRPFTLPAPDTLNPITDVVLNAQGDPWVAVYVDYLVTEGGIGAFDGTSWTQFETADGLAGANVRRIALDANEDLWVTTSTGLTKIWNFRIGVQEYSARPSFSLFPNPASASVELVTTDLYASNATIWIFDARMRLQRTERVTNGRTRLDLSSLTAGVYFVKLGTSIRKLAVQ